MTRTIQVFCGTWNVNGKQVKEDLSPWLIPPNGLSPDLYALGFQEFDLTRESFVTIDETRVAGWDAAIVKCLQRVGRYVQIGRQQLVGMLIILYAKEEIAPEVTDLDSDMIGTGYAGIFGNKGGVGIRFRIGNDTFCFVNSHLNAHAHNVERRNNDYRSICSRMVFTPRKSQGTNKPQTPMELPADLVTEDRETESSLEMPPIETDKVLQEGQLSVFDHTHFLWMGDLNYRIDLARDELLRGITERDWAPLLAADQLRREIAKGDVFPRFTEGPIDFQPSYKFDSGTDCYDSSRKMRLPAYCDRVLWREDAAIQSLAYSSHMELKASDHKPVSAVLAVRLAPVTPAKRKDGEAASPAARKLQQQNDAAAPTTPASLPAPPPVRKDANGLAASGFPRKSYFVTTGGRFLRALARDPSTYIVGAVFFGILSYALFR